MYLSQIDRINVTNVIVSLHNNLAVNSELKVFTDGFDAVGLILNNSACHFYSNMMCIESIDVYTESRSCVSSIYMVDSCQNSIIQFQYSVNETIKIKNVFSLTSQCGGGVPVSAIRSSLNSLTVLTKYPSQISFIKF